MVDIISYLFYSICLPNIIPSLLQMRIKILIISPYDDFCPLTPKHRIIKFDLQFILIYSGKFYKSPAKKNNVNKDGSKFHFVRFFDNFRDLFLSFIFFDVLF